MDGVTDEELDELLYRHRAEPLKILDERVDDVFHSMETNAEGKMELEPFTRISERVLFCRD